MASTINPITPPDQIPPALVIPDAQDHFTATGTITPGFNNLTCANMSANTTLGGTSLPGTCQAITYNAAANRNNYAFQLSVEPSWAGQTITIGLVLTPPGGGPKVSHPYQVKIESGKEARPE
jgi:hypothetical protein